MIGSVYSSKQILFTAIITVLFSTISGTAMATEEPVYNVVFKEDEFELRHYAPKLIAQTQIQGGFNEASMQGFRTLADYIFGNNTGANSNNSTKINMTKPVTMAAENTQNDNEKIAMTKPVALSQQDGVWIMNFTMPAHYTMATIPKPNIPAVTLHDVPETNYAVIRFSGLAGESRVSKKTAELQRWMVKKNLRKDGKPEIARYDPPWTLPFLRRNEVMIKYVEGHSDE